MTHLSDVLLELCVDGSFHGVNHFFGRSRTWLLKLIWVSICVATTIASVYFTVLSFHEIVIGKPTVTNVQYITHSELQFPRVLFCPALPNQTQIDLFTPPSAQGLVNFLATFSENPLFAGARHDFRDNLTLTLLKHPYLETNWKTLFQEGNPSEQIQDLYGQLSFCLIVFPASWVFFMASHSNLDIAQFSCKFFRQSFFSGHCCLEYLQIFRFSQKN